MQLLIVSYSTYHRHITMNTTHKDSCFRTVKILAKIRAKCRKCWGVLKNATVPTTATSNGAQLTVHLWARECRCRCLATYASKPLLFPRESAYVAATKKRSEEIAECDDFFFFLEFSPLFSLTLYLASFARFGFSLLETEATLLSRPLFPTRKRSLRRFVSEGEAVVTNFTPPPSTLILIRENTIRGSAAAGLTENFLPTNPP